MNCDIKDMDIVNFSYSFIIEYPPPEKDGRKQIPGMEDDLLLSVVLLACPVWRLFAAEESGRCNQESSSALLSP